MSDKQVAIRHFPASEFEMRLKLHHLADDMIESGKMQYQNETGVWTDNLRRPGVVITEPKW